MIRKLRKKFIAISMLSLFAVLFFIISTSTALSYYQLIQEADDTLKTLQENNGAFPKGTHLFRSPELPFESRYFSVQLTNQGNLIAADTNQIAAIDRNTAISYAENILASDKVQGFVGTYRYAVQDLAEGKRIIFLDCSRSFYHFQNFFITSLVIATLGMAAVLILIILFSKRIVQPVAESYEKQKRFITDAGHEIKTPLAIIRADADVLEMDLENNEWISDIKEQTRKLTDLTNDLISLSRMDEEQLPQQLSNFSLSQLAEESVHSFQAMAVSQKKNFQVQIAPNLTLHGDPKMLARLLSILLDNALKYCPAQGEIDFMLTRHGKSARLELTNSATNIQSSELPHLFDRFYRTDQSRNSQTGGYGIGLSIANSIVMAHKGKISASTKDGNSLTMTVTLPLL
ncbi:MAG: HAMP domain-containing sensor histidine kinase [bacterium]|nr:HAMP domain-containing sensor histidine kinase [bacterium]